MTSERKKTGKNERTLIERAKGEVRRRKTSRDEDEEREDVDREIGARPIAD